MGLGKAAMKSLPMACSNAGIIAVSVGPGLMQFTRTPCFKAGMLRCIV